MNGRRFKSAPVPSKPFHSSDVDKLVNYEGFGGFGYPGFGFGGFGGFGYPGMGYPGFGWGPFGMMRRGFMGKK
ncbi:hypothetical protein RB195_014019 [Necator americanus]|uniref:Spore coat protein n=1 Tax=Necator americanus TaxID=51031 RepID=A0ABR1DYE7_NECAM